MDKKKKSTLFTRLFGNRNKVTDFMTEEQLQSPGRLILKTSCTTSSVCSA